MRFLKHLIENPFILFTGLAALVHSTWSLGTLFSGEAPIMGVQWVFWVMPAFFIAFALDVGQISTSAKIRHGGLTWRRGLTFGTFSLAVYYLQFLYIAHHMPALEIAAGISAVHRGAVTVARDLAIWFLPSLLPLSTFLYTLSDDRQTIDEPVLQLEVVAESEEEQEEEVVPLAAGNGVHS